MEDLKYPVGKYQLPQTITREDRRTWLDEIATAPRHLRAAVARLSESQLDTPYRPGGWTVRQVVHHVPDSHMHCFIRIKFALTEAQPTIKPYDEALWAELPDTKAPIEMSLGLLDALHARWMSLVEPLTEAQWKRTFLHPELGARDLEQTMSLYAWHGRHHVAHITRLRDSMGW
jgi:hypothetical protein